MITHANIQQVVNLLSKWIVLERLASCHSLTPVIHMHHFWQINIITVTQFESDCQLLREHH